MNIRLQPGRYVVAVSGGVDSMVLLHLLKGLPDVKLTIAHFDHGIRKDSKQDRQLVQTTAQGYGLPFVFDEGNLGKDTSEATARNARYKFLRRVREMTSARAIITAHHQDDAIETALINWLRGTNRLGYTSLSSTSTIVRPLLDVPKQELVNYAKRNKLAWHEDSTNQDTKYLRNLIRLKVMPQLTVVQRDSLAKTLNELRGLNDRIDQKLVHFLHTQPSRHKINRHWFIMLPHDVALEVLAMWLRLNRCTFDSKLLERLVVGAKTLPHGKQMDVDKTHFIEVNRKDLALSTRER